MLTNNFLYFITIQMSASFDLSSWSFILLFFISLAEEFSEKHQADVLTNRYCTEFKLAAYKDFYWQSVNKDLNNQAAITDIYVCKIYMSIMSTCLLKSFRPDSVIQRHSTVFIREVYRVVTFHPMSVFTLREHSMLYGLIASWHTNDLVPAICP